jgi:3-keto-5-aminohexanoate cleavage enzyme
VTDAGRAEVTVPDPVIVELAVNGATPRSRNRHVPRDPAEIAEVALAAVELGASIVHSHNEEPMFTADGVHAVEPYLASWRPVLERHPELLMYPTMAAGARGIGVERRWAHVEELARRGMGGMTLVDPGSVNLGLASDGSVAEGAGAGPYANSLSDIDYMFARSAELGAAPSISVFEPGFLRAVLTWQRCGRLPAGAMVKLYFGGELEFGLPPTAAGLAAYLELLEPSGLPWSVAVLGGDVVGCGLAERAIRRGGHVRVGLEDWAGAGKVSNLDLLRDVTVLLEQLGRRPATVRDARQILGIASVSSGDKPHGSYRD